MVRTFVVNGITYRAKEFGFGMVCDLEEMGITLDKVQKMPMSAVRAYFAICANLDKDSAGEEIQAHILNGGDLNVVAEVMGKMLEESDFFQKLNENNKEEVTESKDEKTTKKK